MSFTEIWSHSLAACRAWKRQKMTEGEIDKDSVKLPCTMIRPIRTLWRSTGRASHVRRWLTEIGESSGKISAYLIRVWMWQGRLCHTETGRKLLCLKSSWSLSRNWYALVIQSRALYLKRNIMHLDVVIAQYCEMSCLDTHCTTLCNKENSFYCFFDLCQHLFQYQNWVSLSTRVKFLCISLKCFMILCPFISISESSQWVYDLSQWWKITTVCAISTVSAIHWPRYAFYLSADNCKSFTFLETAFVIQSHRVLNYI